VQSVRLRGVFEDPAAALKLDSCSESEEKCTSLLDQPFVCPDYLESVIKKETLNDLFGFYKRVTTDESPNMNNNLKVNEQQ
jgi:hypothetical protein